MCWILWKHSTSSISLNSTRILELSYNCKLYFFPIDEETQALRSKIDLAKGATRLLAGLQVLKPVVTAQMCYFSGKVQSQPSSRRFCPVLKNFPLG